MLRLTVIGVDSSLEESEWDIHPHLNDSLSSLEPCFLTANQKREQQLPFLMDCNQHHLLLSHKLI